jgi:PadR family transcriptional regulator, regulatory protein PadR
MQQQYRASIAVFRNKGPRAKHGAIARGYLDSLPVSVCKRSFRCRSFGNVNGGFAQHHGLEVLRSLEDASELSVAEGTLYPILNRLRVEGLLESEWVDSGTGHPRKYYKLTEPGRRRVKEMSRAWAEFSDKLNAILKSIGMKG